MGTANQFGVVGFALVLGAAGGHVVQLGQAVAQDAPACSTLIDCAQKAMEAALEAKQSFRIAAPAGAVMAFDLNECPQGWEPFQKVAGRVIVGGGIELGSGLTERKYKEAGGEENHKLLIDEMPSHNHYNGEFKYLLASNGSWTINGSGQDDSSGEPNLAHQAQIQSAGGDRPHNNMQPYYTLNYCRRT